MAVSDACVYFLAFLTPLLTQLIFQNPLTTFSHMHQRWKVAEKKVKLNRVSNSQPPGHELDTPPIKVPGRASY